MELYIPPETPERNPLNGRFNKVHVPHNKGKKWIEWMDRRKHKKVLKIGINNLKKGRKNICGWNKKPVIMIEKDGKHTYFESLSEA